MLRRFVVGLSTIVVAGLLTPAPASAHCDALDGPVVQAARAALDRGDVGLVLRWVTPEREADVRDAFTRTAAVRALGPAARTLADTWFFETVVRIHRAGEGAPFDGLKPAGHVEAFAAAVDRTLSTGSPDEVSTDVTDHVARGVKERFARAREAQARADTSVDAGRQFVAAYVDYLHYVEALYKAGAGSAEEHQEATASAHSHP
jgi:hypothetical protein